MSEDFGILILSARRAYNVETWKLLDKLGSTLPRKIVLDDEDPTAEEYVKKFSEENIIYFSKEEYLQLSDTFTPSSDRPRNIVLPARNACFDIAKNLGWQYFIELDDDYTNLETRYVEDGKLKSKTVKSADAVFLAMKKFLEKSGAGVIALAQGGDFIGGVGSRGCKNKFLRKMMNVYCFRTNSAIRFYGYLNEDLTASVVHGQRGDLILTCTSKEIHQSRTQTRKGGLTEEYCQNGTFAKSMCSVIAAPSAVDISVIKDKYWREHHRVSWRKAAVKIVREIKD